MTTYNHQQSYDQLKLRIKTICDKIFTPPIPFTIRGAANQRLNETYIQLWIREWNKLGRFDRVDLNSTSVKYEVVVDIAVHRPPTATTLTGSTTVSLSKIIHALEASTGSYFDTFNDGNISYLRSSSITTRHWPLDRTQLEERSTVSCVFEVVVVETDPTDVGYIHTVHLNLETENIQTTNTITYP